MMSQVFLSTLVAAFIVGLIGATQVSFTDCGSQNGKIVAVNITPCASEPCTFTRGQQVLVEVDFMTSLNQSKTAQLTAYATIFGQKLPLGLNQPDACQLPGTTCPLVANVLEKPVETVDVPSDVPPVFTAIPLQVTMTGDNNQNIFCGQIYVKLS